MKIEIEKREDGYFTVHLHSTSGERIADNLNWHELVGLVTALTMDASACRQWLLTPEAHAAEVAQRRETRERLEQQWQANRERKDAKPPTYCLGCKKPIDTALPHLLTMGGAFHPPCFRESAPAAESEVPT